MPVSTTNSQLIYDASRPNGTRLVSALPETWLVHLIRMAEDDPEMTLVRLAKEEEGVGISAGAHLAGVKSAMLMQNHGFLASINGIVSLAQLYKIPLLMLICYRGEFGERDPWQTAGRRRDRAGPARARHPLPRASTTRPRRDAIRQAQTLAESRAEAGRAAAVPRPDVGGGELDDAARIERALQAIYPRSSDTSSS